MMYYKISHGSVTLGNNTVLEDINFCVKDNEKIGIVGRNGSGKTTLLKAIASEYEINSGYEEVDIISSGDFNIGYVKQNDGYSLDMKMIDYIRSSFKDILDIDAVTGGFNLQVAWSTGYTAGLSASMCIE